MKDEDRNDSLVAAAAGLATGIAPQRDLWPGIAERIAAPRRSHRWHYLAQAAAVLLLVGGSSLVTFIIMKEDVPSAPTVVPELEFRTVSLDSRYVPGPVYIAQRADLAAQLDEELQRLSPETRNEVVENLAVIRTAIADINAALAEEPTNPLLQGLLLRAYRDEMALMNRVGGLARRVMSREDI
jgi:hypothetical protein